MKTLTHCRIILFFLYLVNFLKQCCSHSFPDKQKKLNNLILFQTYSPQHSHPQPCSARPFPPSRGGSSSSPSWRWSPRRPSSGACRTNWRRMRTCCCCSCPPCPYRRGACRCLLIRYRTLATEGEWITYCLLA